jgi:hypothetical protein
MSDNTTENNNIIKSFIHILNDSEYSLDTQTVADLSEIDTTLSSLQNQPVELAADAIVDWCNQHTDIRDGVLSTNLKPHKAAGSGESAIRDTTLFNQYPEIKEVIKWRQGSSNDEKNKNSDANS